MDSPAILLSSGKWPSALCGASMTLRHLRVMTNCRKVKRTQILKHSGVATLQGRVSCQSWVSSLAFHLRLTRCSSRPSCSGVLTPSCAPSYLTGLSAAARSDGCRHHHYRRANNAVAIHQSKKPPGDENVGKLLAIDCIGHRVNNPGVPIWVILEHANEHAPSFWDFDNLSTRFNNQDTDG
jgi:hypothetical protein